MKGGNFVNKLRRQSIRNYFVERCTGGPKQKDFRPTIKPFLTNKGSHFENNIISFVIGFTITGLAIFIIFTDTPSKPVALFTLILLICFSTKSSLISV
jgi:hypothetical protein